MARLGEYGYYGPYGNSGTTTSSAALANALSNGRIIYRVQDTNLFRDAKGRFTKAQKEIERLNRQLAKTMQESVVRETYRNQRRPGVSTKRLKKAWENPDHLEIPAGGARYGFALFDPALMDRSQAKYWRLIEYGTKDVLGGRWTGRMVDSEGIPLFGRWGGSIQGYYQNRWGTVPRAGAPWLSPDSRGGKLRPAPQSIRESMINPKTGKTPKAAYRRNHIPPKDAIDTTWRKYGSDRYATRLLTSIRKELGIP